MPPGLVLKEKRLSLDVPMSASSDTLLHEPNVTSKKQNIILHRFTNEHFQRQYHRQQVTK